MSLKGSCWGNAVPESSFPTLKTELIHRQAFHSREEAKQAIFEHIEAFYLCPVGATVSGYIPLMGICHLQVTSCSKWPLKHVPSKVLTHHLHSNRALQFPVEYTDGCCCIANLRDVLPICA